MKAGNSIVQYMTSQVVSDNIKETLGKKTPQFIASVAALVNSNKLLEEADRHSILAACLTAAALDLPINQNLGFAYIIAYKKNTKVKNKDSKTGKEIEIWNTETVAQFQMGWKGFIQLAQRSGQFKTINVTDVRVGEIKGMNRLTGKYEFEWLDEKRETIPVAGYVAYMELNSGFEKTLYMTVEELQGHGLRYSQTMKKGIGMWKDQFDAMAKKTVLKLLLSKYAPLTSEMQKAQLADQAVISDDSVKYIDNLKAPVDAKGIAAESEKKSIADHIKNAKTVNGLEQCLEAIGADKELKEAYDKKLSALLDKETS